MDSFRYGRAQQKTRRTGINGNQIDPKDKEIA